MTDRRRYKPQIRAATSRRWPNRSTVPNLAAGTPSRSKHSVDTIQRGHVPKRNACTRSPAPITKAAVAPERWVRTRAADPRCDTKRRARDQHGQDRGTSQLPDQLDRAAPGEEQHSEDHLSSSAGPGHGRVRRPSSKVGSARTGSRT